MTERPHLNITSHISGILFDIPSHILWGILLDISFDILADILCDILRSQKGPAVPTDIWFSQLGYRSA